MDQPGGRPEEGRARHWDGTYRDRGATGVSWYQSDPAVSLELIAALGLERDAPIVDVGGGASVLTDRLLASGFSDLTVLDVSQVALDNSRGRLPAEAPVERLCQDVLGWNPSRRFGLWHDRAVFHFLTDDDDRDRYRVVLREALLPGGAVIIATFAPDGPTHCSGLPVCRYGPADLAAVLGDGFEVEATLREEHTTPTGAVQPFTWLAARARRPGPGHG